MCVCLSLRVCVVVLLRRQQQLLAQFCLFGSLDCCLLGYFPQLALSLSLSHSLLPSLSFIKIQFKIFDLILFARRFPDAHVPLKRFAFALPFVLVELCSWPQSSGFLCVCMYICVYTSLCMSKDTLPHTHIVGTWATIVCQPKQQICNGNPKLFSSTLAMSKIPLFMKISLENCYKLFMLIQIGEFQNENIIYKTMCVVSNSSHSSREVKDEFV